MSEVRLNIIDSRDAHHGTVHGSIADAVIASLSAEPETIAELDAALDRFNKRLQPHSPFISFDDGENTEPWDAGVVVVDLAARIVAAESTYSGVLAEGEVNYHDGYRATDTWLPYKLPDDWLILNSVLEYESLRDERRALRAANPPIDTRLVLYGRPLIEFIVSECSAVYEGSHDFVIPETKPESNAQEEHDADREDEETARSEGVLRSVHARWLTSPRIDLGGRSPREVILAKKALIDFDLSSREQQWSILREGPPPLSRDSSAYRFAGFGTHEYVIYYDLVRHLLGRCWERLSQHRRDKYTTSALQSEDGAPAVAVDAIDSSLRYSASPGPKVDNLVESLEQAGHVWLNSPSRELGGRIPAAMIESERRRIPLTMSAKDVLIDENCDLCRMLADESDLNFSPAFWHLDGSHMDDGFEFSAYQTLEEWEAEQRRWREFTEEFERNWLAEHPPSGEVNDKREDDDDDDSALDVVY